MRTPGWLRLDEISKALWGLARRRHQGLRAVEGLEDRTLLAIVTVTTATDEDDGLLGGNSGISLREAIRYSAAGDEIRFDAALNGTNILLTRAGTFEDLGADGDLDISHDLIIQGNGAAQTILSAGSDLASGGSHAGLGERVLHVLSGVDLTLNGVTVTGGNAAGSGENGNGGGLYVSSGGAATVNDAILSGNSASGGNSGNGGGIFSNSATTSVMNSTLSENTAANGGGIFSVYGTTTITDSTLSRNSAGYAGGGLWNYVGTTIVITNSTLSENTADYGGGMWNQDALLVALTNSTLSGNSADFNGGGIYNSTSTVTLLNSTLSGNSAVFNGGGIFNYGWITLNNSIVAGSPSGTDIYLHAGSLSGTNNLIQDGSYLGFFTSSISGDPKLGPLQDNGGPTRTHLLADGSPAINAGSNAAAAGLSTDQRGFVRMIGSVDVGALEVQHLLVDTAVDEVDGNLTPGDLSLREAIIAANDAPCPVTIHFAAALNGVPILLTRPGTYEDAALNGDLDIAGKITILGNGIAHTIISAGSNLASGGSNVGLSERVLHVLSGAELTLHSLTITGGNAAGGSENANGGGLYIAGTGTATISDVTVSGNNADLGSGGGIANYGTLAIADSTLTGNRAYYYGGGVFNSTSATATLTRSTLSGNSSGTYGGGVFNTGSSVSITDSTLSGNSASGSGGGIFSNSGTLTLTNSTLSANRANSSGGGIYNSGSSMATITDSVLSANQAINNSGGGVYNRDSGNVLIARSTITGNSSGSGGGGGGIFNSNSSEVTVAESIITKNSAIWGGGVINYNVVSFINSTLSENTATYGGGIFTRDAGKVEITNSTLSRNTASLQGGGIWNYNNFNSGQVTLTNSTLSGNTANYGGGIYNYYRAVVTITNSTLSGNSARGEGGGVWSYNGTTLTIANSTFSGNAAETYGGGVLSTAAATATVTNSSFSGNTAGIRGGGLYLANGTTSIRNSIVARSTIGGDVYFPSGSLSGTNNLIQDGSNLGRFTDSLSGDPLLGPLQDNGGPTMTHALLNGSPAIDAGSNAAASGLTTDQRGYARVFGSTVDIGAYEAINEAPVVILQPKMLNLLESTILAGDLKVADVIVQDDALGSYTLGLAGADAAKFRLIGNTLYLKEGTSLDFETQPLLNVEVTADDPALPNNPDASDTFQLRLLDVYEPPEADVFVNSVAVPDGSTVNFGETEVGGSGPSRVFVVRNTGVGDLVLQPITVPAGFTLLTPNFTAGQVVVPGAEVTFTIVMETATAGTLGGELRFINSDSNESEYNIRLAGAVLIPATGVTLIDDGDAGFYATGAWNSVANYGYSADAKSTKSADGSRRALWAFGGLTPGQYRISATWLSGSDRSTSVPVVIRDGVGGPILAQITLNERIAPVGTSIGSRPFQVLDSVALSGSTLVVEFSNAGTDKVVVADAVRIENITPPPDTPEITVRQGGQNVVDGSTVALGTVPQGGPLEKTIVVRNDGTAPILLSPLVLTGSAYSLVSPNFTEGQTLSPGEEVTFTIGVDTSMIGTFNGSVSFGNNDADESAFDILLTATVRDPSITVMTIDNGDPEFSLQGVWTGVTRSGYGADAAAVGKLVTGAKASWTFGGITPGTFNVSTTWLSGSDRASNATYVIRDGVGGSILATVQVNQKTPPVGVTAGGRPFQQLQQVTLTGSTLVVELLNAGADGVIVADAVRIERVIQ